MHRRNAVVGMILFSILTLSLFLSIALLSGSKLKQETPNSNPGFCDLSGFDFSQKLAYILHTSFLYYPNALYTSKDFATGQVTQVPVVLNNVGGRFNPGDYGTYRIVLELPKGQTYGISSYSAMYSQRLFINGTEYPSIGTPGETAEDTVPKTTHYTAYFTPETAETEIVIQFANFCHADYGGIVPIYVGAQDRITARDAAVQQRVNLLTGCIFTAFLFSIGMFVFFHRRYAFLWFALTCCMTGLRMLITEEKVIMLLIPALPWKLSISLEYITLIALMYFFMLYIHSMFPGALGRVSLWAFGAVCAVYAMVVLVAPPFIYTRYVRYFEAVAVLFGLYVVVALVYHAVFRKARCQTEHHPIFVGIFIFIVLSTLDIQAQRGSIHGFPIGLTAAGMLVFIFFNMIALVLQFSRTEVELDEARRSEREAQEKNRLLDEMSRLKTDFLANISHEMRTPLTVMASYAGLTAMQIRRGAMDEKTLDNLAVIQRESKRLAGLLGQLKEVALEKERRLALTDTDALTLLREAADFCEPICRKNKNHISVNAEPISLRVNADSIFQALVNLIVNANRHTHGGCICLQAEQTENCVVVTVRDNGEGILPERVAELFERGVSGDGGTGLGLPICKEIIAEHGGKITMESRPGEGTSVRFTLPKPEGDGKI